MDTLKIGDKQYCTTCHSQQIIKDMEVDFGGVTSICSKCNNDMDLPEVEV